MPPCAASRYLWEVERIQIAGRVREKASIREIARELGRAPSTISRETAATAIPSTPGTGHTRPRPERAEMHMCHETIYQALDVQGRGELRREPTRALRTGRTMHRPRRLDQQRQPRYAAPMAMISDFPKGTDLSVHTREDLDAVAAERNTRPGKTLDRETFSAAAARPARDDYRPRAWIDGCFRVNRSRSSRTPVIASTVARAVWKFGYLG